MRTYWITAAIAVTGVVLAACGGVEDVPTTNKGGAPGVATGGSAVTGGNSTVGQGGSSAGGTLATGGSSSPGVGGSTQTGGSGSGASLGGSPPTLTGGSAGTPATGGSAGTPATGGSAGTPATGGSAGTPATGGSAGMPQGGGGGSTAGGVYAPRTGSFKMLVYSRVIAPAYAHPSIAAGQRMLQDIAKKQGFEVTIATDESDINPTGLAKYEIVFFLNSTGEIFNSGTQRADFEAWMREKGAFAGMHGATDSAKTWQFYKEITGQYYDGHDPCCAMAQMQFTATGQTHVVAKGLPNPWSRSEEWYKFASYTDWSSKAGFTVLSTVTNGGATRPVSYVREWGNFRAFYTSLGHEDGPYSDANVIKHVSAGIMWAVRREALIVP
jgi:uncharacterized protein